MHGLRATVIPVIAALTACGGGGGGGGSDPAPQPPAPPPAQTVTVEGVAHKGPFSTGAAVSVSAVLANGSIGANLADTTVTDNLGRYAATLPENQLVEIAVAGSFMDELDGAPSQGPTTLRLVTQTSSSASQTANVNLLTHLAAARIRALLAAGSTIDAALAQARDDVLGALAPLAPQPAPAPGSFGALSLFSDVPDDADSAYLVTVSSVFLARARDLAVQNGTDTAAELQAILDSLADDLSDGEIADTASFDDLRAASASVDPEQVMSNLADLAGAEGSSDHAGNIQMFLDTDQDGSANAADDDDDGDGVADADDAFPYDQNEFRDADGDGIGDNGDPDDDNDLVADGEDAYPEDPLCYLAEDGNGTVCDIEATLPASYVPDVIDTDGEDIVYLLSSADNRVFRWSIADQRHLFSLRLPAGAVSMAFSRFHDRLYVGFASGQVVSIDPVGRHDQTDFAVADDAVIELVDAGNHLLLIDAQRAWYTYTFGGQRADKQELFRPSRSYAWSNATNRLYSFRDSTSPNDVVYQEIDPTSGLFGDGGDSPYHGDFAMTAPIRVSGDGDALILGSGDVYAGDTLTWQRSLPGQFSDVILRADGGTESLRPNAVGTRFERRDSQGRVAEFADFPGAPLRVLAGDTGVQVVTQESRPEFHLVVPGGDLDADGVANPDDAYPTDPAASVDSDRDGHPDAWNDGRSAGDSTTGLTLDSYPNDAACFLPGHGDGVNCDIAGVLPAYFPDRVVSATDGVVYLLSGPDNRVFRWSPAAGDLNPLPIGLDDGGTAVMMSYSPELDRLYLGYDSGQITYFDLADGAPAELYLGAAPTTLRGLQAAGIYLWAAGGNAQTTGRYNLSFDATGSVVDRVEIAEISANSAWNAALDRIYFFRDGISPNDIHYQTVDQANGQLGAPVDSPFHGSFLITPPIRISAGGDRVLLGSGDVYDADNLNWLGAIPTGFTDAQWLSDDGIVVVRDESGSAQVERRDAAGTVVEVVPFSGVPLAIVPSGADHVVVTDQGGPVFHVYVASDDSDGDGVPNTEDDFPLDPAASVDSDGDGYPDAWNDGRTEADSTTGLTLDSYPSDSACYLPEHGDGVTCDITATMPDYVPASIEMDDAGVVYLFSPENGRIFRWDSVTEEHLNPIIVGSDEWLASSQPTIMAYHSAHFRLYLGYDNGDVNYIDLAGDPDEQRLTTLAQAVGGLADVGNFLLAQDASGAWESHHIYDADGGLRTSVEWNHYSRAYDWNPVLNRVYFFRDGSSPNDLLYEEIDQTSGLITDAGETPYHGDFVIAPPIRSSAGGDKVLLGSGDVYDASDLTRLGSIAGGFTDAQWLGDDGIVVVRDESGNAQVERRDAAGMVVEVVSFDGVPLAIAPSGANHVVVTDQGRPAFHIYIASDDSDGDGVTNTEDDFPLDPAASVDSDGDGYPDAWNDGRTEADSTTGLTLDSYPSDSACYLPEHGDGITCDITATMPDYVPASIEVDDAGVVHLFSPENGRIFRWDSVTEEHLNPIIVGSDEWLASSTPTIMAYHSAHFRLYLGYDNGDVNYIDLAGDPDEQRLTTLAQAVGGLADVGNFLLAQDASGAWNSHHIYDADGGLRTSVEWNEYSRVYEWNPVLNRVYFFRDGTSPNDLHYEEIDQTSGLITDAGETPYHGNYVISPPIRSSAGGDKVLLGSGDVYDASDLTRLGSIAGGFTDARWLSDDGIVVVRDESGNAQVERRDAAGTVVEAVSFDGAPLAIAPSGANHVVVTDQGRPAFHIYIASDDSDGDGVPNTEDDFPLDPAASVDSDGDGYPDAWNDGRTEADSTTGLTLDSYPSDSACYLPEHGDGVTCDITATMPDYVPASIEMDDAGVVYLFSPENGRIFRWDSVTEEHLNPIIVGSDEWLASSQPTIMAYHSAHFRLYLGYDNGDVNYIDLAGDPDEQRLTTLAQAVGGLADVGNFLLAQDASGAWESHHIYDADGGLRTSVEWNHYSRAYDWNPVLNRVYFFRDGSSPNDLLYEEIDQTSGLITDAGETPYHGNYVISPPIRVSADGSQVLLGSGSFYDAENLTWLFNIPGSITDAEWLLDGRVVTLRASGGDSLLEVLDTSYSSESSTVVSNPPLASLRHGNDIVVVTAGVRPEFVVITP